MYCPKCRSEYREGFIECADCLAPLIVNLPPEESEPVLEYIDIEEIMTSSDSGEITMARSILDDHQISCLVQGENYSTCCGCMPARIYVPKDQADEAKDLLENFL